MANRRDSENREHGVRRSWMEKLSTEALLEGLKDRSFRGGRNTVAKEILRERGVSVEADLVQARAVLALVPDRAPIGGDELPA